jgi:hypothetical protein
LPVSLFFDFLGQKSDFFFAPHIDRSIEIDIYGGGHDSGTRTTARETSDKAPLGWRRQKPSRFFHPRGNSLQQRRQPPVHPGSEGREEGFTGFV